MKMTIVLFWLGLTSAALAADGGLRLSTFHADVTPGLGPIGSMAILTEVKSIEHPLEARGVVLEFGGKKHVLTAIDYCGLCNASHDIFREKIAAAIGTDPDLVVVQALHQHTAPVLDIDGAKIAYSSDEKALKLQLDFSQKMAERVAEAAKKSLSNLQPVTRVVASRAKVDRVASNRRVRGADGTITARYSATEELELRAMPEGLIDPWLRTVTFASGDRTLAQLHYYATHPQSFYGDYRISYDVPGIARQRLERETDVFQVYFSGCSGNITMGKYNDGTREARAELTERLYDAMRRSAEASRQRASSALTDRTAAVDFTVDTAKLGSDAMSWKVAPLRFAVRHDGKYADAQLDEAMANRHGPVRRAGAAMNIAWNRRLNSGRFPRVARLQLGPIQIVHLPGEPFIEFQLYGQQVAPKSFVCTAGYGDCGVWYYGPDSIYKDRGGYEQNASYTTPAESQVKGVLDELLK